MDKAEIHLNNIFEPGQLYVAISRVKHIEGLSIITSTAENIFKGIIADQEVLKFYDLLQA